MYITSFIKYNNQYITGKKFIDVKLIINFLIKDNVFNFHSSCSTHNTKLINLF